MKGRLLMRCCSMRAAPGVGGAASLPPGKRTVVYRHICPAACRGPGLYSPPWYSYSMRLYGHAQTGHAQGMLVGVLVQYSYRHQVAEYQVLVPYCTSTRTKLVADLIAAVPHVPIPHQQVLYLRVPTRTPCKYVPYLPISCHSASTTRMSTIYSMQQ